MDIRNPKSLSYREADGEIFISIPPDPSDPDIDNCVVCNEPTEYKTTDPIQERSGYFEGCGQLCRPCMTKVTS